MAAPRYITIGLFVARQFNSPPCQVDIDVVFFTDSMTPSQLLRLPKAPINPQMPTVRISMTLTVRSIFLPPVRREASVDIAFSRPQLPRSSRSVVYSISRISEAHPRKCKESRNSKPVGHLQERRRSAPHDIAVKRDVQDTTTLRTSPTCCNLDE